MMIVVANSICLLCEQQTDPQPRLPRKPQKKALSGSRQLEVSDAKTVIQNSAGFDQFCSYVTFVDRPAHGAKPRSYRISIGPGPFFVLFSHLGL